MLTDSTEHNRSEAASAEQTQARLGMVVSPRRVQQNHNWTNFFLALRDIIRRMSPQLFSARTDGRTPLATLVLSLLTTNPHRRPHSANLRIAPAPASAQGVDSSRQIEDVPESASPVIDNDEQSESIDWIPLIFVLCILLIVIFTLLYSFVPAFAPFIHVLISHFLNFLSILGNFIIGVLPTHMANLSSVIMAKISMLSSVILAAIQTLGQSVLNIVDISVISNTLAGAIMVGGLGIVITATLFLTACATGFVQQVIRLRKQGNGSEHVPPPAVVPVSADVVPPPAAGVPAPAPDSVVPSQSSVPTDVPLGGVSASQTTLRDLIELPSAVVVPPVTGDAPEPSATPPSRHVQTR